MNFKIYLVGDKIPKHYQCAIGEYEKRLSRYCKTSLSVLKNEDLLHKSLTGGVYTVYVSSKGHVLSSTDLSQVISQYGLKGTSEVGIVYGKEPAHWDEHWAISPMDIEDGLLMTILYEQIYRAYRIMNQHAYHK